MAREERSAQSAPDVSSGSGGWSSEESASEVLTEFGVNAALVEEIHQRYEVDPTSVHPSWAQLFREEEEGEDLPAEAPAAASPAAPEAASEPAPSEFAALGDVAPHLAEKHARVLRLIHSYRARGHRIAKKDPLGADSSYFPELDPAHYGFGQEDLDRPFIAGDLPGGPIQTLREILALLEATYCRSIGVEFTHIQEPGRKLWLQRHLEETQNTSPVSTEDRLRILQKIAAAELFERFIHTRFLGQKRFSLEGSEVVIPLLDRIVEDAPTHGIAEIVFGMAHRGRLNVLSNVVGRSLEMLFSEFEDAPLLDSPFGSGDVKYHKGYTSDRVTQSGAHVHLSLTSNPSHLEAVDPVVEGRARAKQTRAGDKRGRTILPLLLHGDAAFSGQGIVAETLNLSHLAGYSTGGTLHVVINNQIGFTANPAETRSTLYCTDVAKMIQAPIFHVNGDDVDAVIHCARLAIAYRQRFASDVVIDVFGYRRHGHNEGDEPSYTQPLLYERIRQQEPLRKIYTAQLLALGVLREDDVARIEADLSAQLAQALQMIKTRTPEADEPYEPRGPWTGFSRTAPPEPIDTAVPIERLTQIAEGLARVPAGFKVHPKLMPMLEKRCKVIAEDGTVDWTLAEALAFGSLLVEGTPVRLSGQDSARGTFSQRHAVLVNQHTGEEYAPLDHLTKTQARFEVYDSLLSEAAVLGFEYGYSVADPTTLTLWEAQFGDFANGAQVIIDQFISSAHVKWGRMSGLVMLLPHGYEGQGPEHSSARIERYLQLCAEDNLQVANCTTPAQYFHLLRRQMVRRYRAPLVIFTPKSLLRAPRVVSSPQELAAGRFHAVLADDVAAAHADAVRRVLVCSGKVYYDLLERQEAREKAGSRRDVAIVRLEQIYPWPRNDLSEAIGRHPRANDVIWVQEEPANMGAFSFVREGLTSLLREGQTLRYAGREASASTAVGSMRLHREEQKALVDDAFAGL
ncbi:MAG: 2-oxoglutarate dehydrogenase E1 component [Deltaproteobacteria bacterium]|nr:2-oxoglutarate dehydrogenase E1 component [Deltaproteobacteria bacterium]